MATDAAALVALLKKEALSLCTAESLTGGLLAGAITAVPGASQVFRGGLVSYQSQVKSALLGVDPVVIEQYGPASKHVAKAMARGARKLLFADLAVAVTGVAGPDPDEFGAPVGLVYLALSGDGWDLCREAHFTGTRTEIRQQTCDAALKLLAQHLLG